jgi:hypothetical protein
VSNTLATIVICALVAYPVGAVIWAVVSVIWEDNAHKIKARWPQWAIWLLPTVFTVYLLFLKAGTIRQMRKIAKEYDATKQHTVIEGEVLQSQVIGRASVKAGTRWRP